MTGGSGFRGEECIDLCQDDDLPPVSALGQLLRLPGIRRLGGIDAQQAKLRRARRSRVLKEGYLTSLTIIKERNNIRPGKMYRHKPVAKTFSSPPHIRNSVTEATSPAADGMGKPRNSFPPLPPGMAARQLNRANRSAPHARIASRFSAMIRSISSRLGLILPPRNASHCHGAAAPHYINRIKVFVPGNRLRLNELD